MATDPARPRLTASQITRPGVHPPAPRRSPARWLPQRAPTTRQLAHSDASVPLFVCLALAAAENHHDLRPRGQLRELTRVHLEPSAPNPCILYATDGGCRMAKRNLSLSERRRIGRSGVDDSHAAPSQ